MENGYLQNGCGLIAAERVRQEQSLGYSAEADDSYTEEQLRDAAIAYAIVCDDRADNPPSCWPWDDNGFKYESPKAANLVKAGALIAAEIDRLHRAWRRECNEITTRDFGFECFDEMNAYDLDQLPWIGVDPKEFVSKHFAEDYERLQWESDEALRAEEVDHGG